MAGKDPWAEFNPVHIDLSQPTATSGAPQPQGGGLREVLSVPDPNASLDTKSKTVGITASETNVADTATDNTRADDQLKFQKQNDLGKRYDNLPEVVNYRKAVPAFMTAIHTAPNATGDNTLIYSYAQVMDPASSVREGEMDMAANGSSWADAKIAELKKQFNIDGGGQLPPEVRDKMRVEMNRKVAQQRALYDTARQRFGADAQASNLEPARVIGPDDAAHFTDTYHQWREDFYKRNGQVPPEQEARTPEMRGGVPAGSDIKFGMDGDGPPTGFDHAEWLKKLGLNPDEEAEIAAFWNANRNNKDFTVPQAKKWFSERGYGLPTDADIAGAVRDARRGAHFGGIDDSQAKAAYEAKLDAENQRRGFDPNSADAGLGQFNQGATLANSDELTGVLGAVGAGLQGQNPIDAYTLNRDLERRQLEQSSEAMPKASLGLNVIGGLIAPVGIVGKGAKAAEYVKAGAKAGALAGFGSGEGFVDSATGAGGGAVAGAVVGKLVGKGAEWLAARKAARGEVVPDLPGSGGVETGGSLPQTAAQAAAAPLSPAEQTEIADLAKKATGWGPKARAARKELARKAAANPEAKAAAERLGVDLPPDILSDDAQLQSLTGLARSEVGSDAETGWRATVANVANQSEQALADLGASPDLAQLSDDVLTRLNGTAESLQRQAGALRDEVNAAVAPGERVTASNLEGVVAKMIDDYGGLAEAKAAMTGPERDLLKMLGEGEEAVKPTYARLNRLRSDIGDALNKNKGPWADVGRKELGDYYRALADDQLAAVEQIGGKELADKQRAANSLFSKMFDQRGEMQDLFGKNLEKGLAPLLKRSLTAGAKGDAKDLTLLLDRVPEDVRGGAMLSAVMSLARSSASHGGFSFANYTKLYRGLRENAPVYAKIAKAVGPGAEQVLRDLYQISNRMAAGETKVLKTGKANQALAASMNAESLVSNVMSAAGGRAGVAVGSGVGQAVGGPVGAAAGATMASAAKQTLGGAGKSRLDKVHGLLTSAQFRETIERVAAGEDPAVAGEGLWNSVAFHKFAKAVGAVKGESRRALLKSLIAGGAEKASAAIDVNLASGPTRMAATEHPRSENADSAKTGRAGQ